MRIESELLLHHRDQTVLTFADVDGSRGHDETNRLPGRDHVVTRSAAASSATRDKPRDEDRWFGLTS